MIVKDCLCLIPARGGSKGVPRKNIAIVGGRPLISYSISLGLEAKVQGLVQDVVVSTDDEEIATVAKNEGASVPYLRPGGISSDNAKSVDVVLHALDYFLAQQITYERVLLLQPTTPLRELEDISRSFSLMNNHDAESLISCYMEEYICDEVSYRKNGTQAVPLSPSHNSGARRQDMAPLYIRNGAIYLAKSSYIRNKHSLIADFPLMHVMPKMRSVNIDTKEDMRYLEWLLQNSV